MTFETEEDAWDAALAFRAKCGADNLRDSSPRVTIISNGKVFHSEEEVDEYWKSERIKNLISCCYSIPEIQNAIGDPDWKPSDKQIRLMEIAKEAERAELKRMGFSRDEMREFFPELMSDGGNRDDEQECVSTVDPSATRISRPLRPMDAQEFEGIIRTPGFHDVLMDDGCVHKINVHANMCFSDCGPKEIKGVGARTKKDNGYVEKKRDALVVSKDSLICIDGSNVIGIDNDLRVEILKAVIRALQQAEYRIKVFVDKTIFWWLRNVMHDEVGAQYISDGEKCGMVVVAPSKAEADGQILQLAEFEGNVHVITNDRYRDYVEIHPWLANRSAGDRLHGVNLVRVNDKVRVLIAGFNLDIVV